MADWDVLLAPWTSEPEPVPEATFTPWADPGWLAWNAHAVEVQIADFVGAFIRWSHPVLTLETGVGQGFITRRYQTNRLLYESDDDWSTRLPIKVEGITPTATMIRQADLTILDSNFPLRFAELWLWYSEAKPDGWLFVHDTGTRHPPGTAYQLLGTTIRSFGLGGLWLDNPRGAWIGRRDGVTMKEVEGLWQTYRP